MKSVINFLRKYKYYFAVIGIGIVIMGVIYYLQNVAPFGKNSILLIDFYHQYGPMLGELYDRIKNGSSLIYSFNMGMGMPFFRNFFNYLSSPFNIIMFLFKRENILMSYAIILGVKGVAAAVSMNYFLKKKFNKNNFMFICLSLLYAFNAYFTAYYWNIMWMDGLVMLPLIIAGLERLINENKPTLYIVSLAIMLFSNYFIAYMICIFCVLYFVFYMFIVNKKYNFKYLLFKFLNFCISSLLAGGICAVFLIPMYEGLRTISATSDIMPSTQYYSFNFSELLIKHFSGVDITVLSSDIASGPNISCGILSISLFFLFIINRSIKLSDKVFYLLLLVILASSFISGPLDFIWHAFHVPNDLPFRYSFLYSFVLIIISAAAVINIKSLKFWKVSTVYFITLILTLSLFIFKFDIIDTDIIVLNLVVITVFYLSFIIYYYFKDFNYFITWFAIITISLEIIICVNNQWNNNVSISGFYKDYDDIKEILNFIDNNDDGYFRLEKDNMHTFNDSSWYGYYGQTSFSSMDYENNAILQHRLGMPGNEINSYYFVSPNPVYSLIFNIKYVMSDNVSEEYYTPYYTNDLYSVYKSNYNVGFMFGVNNIVKTWNTYYTDTFMNYNDFSLKCIDKKVFDKVKFDSDQIVFEDDVNVIKKYNYSSNDNLYIYYDNINIDFLIIDDVLYYNNSDYLYYENVSDLDIYVYEDYNEKYIITSKGNHTIYVGYNDNADDGFYVYSLNDDVFNELYDNLNENKVYIYNFDEEYINGESNFEEDLTVFTSIPYDDGWNVYIDGEKIETLEISNALLGFDVPAGNHVIELKYHLPRLLISVIISIISLGLTGFYIYATKKIKKF